MINEKYQVDEILSGKNIGRYSQFRICYLLAKHYKDEGLAPVDVRIKIFDWAKDKQCYITENVNNVIQSVFKENKPLVSSVNIYVSQDEIDDINKRFDLMTSKITALAILCFAKCYADKNGYVKIPQQELSAWVGVGRQHLSSNIIPELIAFGYLECPDKYQKKRHNKATDRYRYSSKTYKMAVPFTAQDGYEFDGGDILSFYQKIFS